MLAKLAGHHLIPVGLNADGETLTCVELTQRCGDLFGKIFDLPVAETYASSLPSVPPWLRG